MKLGYDAENGLWLLDGWAFEKVGGHVTVSIWNASKGDKWFWARTRKQAIEFARLLDAGLDIPALNKTALY